MGLEWFSITIIAEALQTSFLSSIADSFYSWLDDTIIADSFYSNVNVIPIYVHTANKSDKELEVWCRELEILLKLTKAGDITTVSGDLNAKLENGDVSIVMGDFGLGDRNEIGDRLIEFGELYGLIVMKTWFERHERRLC